MPDPKNAHTLMATLRAQLDLLNTFVLECAVEAVVYDIPRYEGGLVPECIKAKRISGEKAVTLANKAYRNLSCPEDQHPGSVWRVPGAIRVDKDLSKTVYKINEVKKELKEFVMELHPGSKARNTFYRNEFPGRVMLQVYRNIYVVTHPLEKITFTWSPITASSSKLSRQEALDLLIKRSKSGFDHIDKNRFNALKMATDYVRNSKRDDSFAIRKPRSPYPIATVYFEDNDYPPLAVQTSLPLIVGPQDKLPIGDLPTYDKNKRRNTRSDKLKTVEVFKPLYLYHRL